MADNPDKEKSWWRSARFQASVLLAVGLIILGYWLPIPWTGFVDYDAKDRAMKTLWDWMGLLIIPAVLGVGGWLFGRAERQADHAIADKRAEREQRIADARIRDSLLREYIERMSVLLIEQDLATAKRGSPVRYVALARTLTLLNALAEDGPRKGSVVQFLYEAGLIHKEAAVLRLYDANLSGAYLSGINLSGAYLSDTNLSDTNLSGANLRRAILNRTKITEVQLRDARSLQGAYCKINLPTSR